VGPKRIRWKKSGDEIKRKTVIKKIKRKED
jgi:hypothetical protein